MSTIETILTRAMSDASFADLLFADADGALTGYDLTADERASLKSMSRAEFDKYSAAPPEERKSFTLSNVLKAKHDSAQAAIANTR